jgi:hypothetical protein
MYVIMSKLNEIILDGHVYNLVCFWRESKKDKSRDAKGLLYSYPKEESDWSGLYQFVDALQTVQSYVLKNKKLPTVNNFCKNYDKCCVNNKCLICGDKISCKIFVLDGYIWKDDLIHYIREHHIKPNDLFMRMIFDNDIIITTHPKQLHITGRERDANLDGIKHIKLNTNQIMILDALMKHGGYSKKYYDNKINKYSEHAGILDFGNNGLNRIIVAGNTSRVDRGDEEIFLPNDFPDMMEYEYIFHTHPPTPKPGGRASDGILYEFPSIGDMLHFIDHHNDGNTIGSLVMTAEGLYNIRKINHDKLPITIDEDVFYDEIKRKYKENQRNAIKQYGTKFTTYEFYSKIAQDTTYIDNMNNHLKKYGITIDFFPRKKDNKNNWIVSSIYLKIFT